MSALSVTYDEFVYTGLLLFSVGCGHALKKIQNAETKKLACTMLGLAMIIITSGIQILHPIFASIINTIIICCSSKRYCHILSFAFCFGYLLFFRTIHYFGFPSPLATINAVQLILTLKMTSLAFDVHDTYELKNQLKKENGNNLQKEISELTLSYRECNPSFIDCLHYCACYIGIFTGPFYRYRSYHDMIHNQHAESISTVQPMLCRICLLPVYIICFILGNKFFPYMVLDMDEFYLEPLWYRLVYMVPIFFVFRMRFYIAWSLSEAACMTATLGAYPVITDPKIGFGPSKLEKFAQLKTKSPDKIEYNFETINNIGEYQCEFESTVRGVLHYWNRSVQFWLAHYVYKRVPIKSIRTVITMFVSAFWHGIHAGYYLGLLSLPLVMLAERNTEAIFYHNASPLQQTIYTKIAWFFRVRVFDYLCVGFLMLTAEKTLRYWASIYFCIHVLGLICILSGYIYKMNRPKSEKKNDEKKAS